MSDLISRTRRGPGSGAAPGRSLSASAATGGALAAAATLTIAMALGLTAWFLADAGAHGSTTDALGVGADAWLMGHGSHLVAAGLPLGITPLTVTAFLLLGAFRAGRRAARRADPVADDRTLGTAVAVFTGVYLVVAVVVCVVVSQSDASPSLGRAGLGAVLVAAVAGGLGLAAGTGRLEVWADQVPAWAREVLVGAIAGALLLLAAGAVLVAVALLGSFNEAATILSSLDLSTGDALSYTFVMALLAPNIALLGSAYLLGPGFAVGVGTTVSPTAVSLGAVPAFPVLAALPGDGPTSGWLVLVYLVPVLAAGIGATRVNAGADPLPFDVAALRGAASGFTAGVLITVLIAFAGGPLGTGRLSDVGASAAEILVFATGLMSVGGLLGGLLQQVWQRRR
ncbi:MAG: DUF6350 family protein [Marmoricola sp.]